MDQKLEALARETQKSLKEIQHNTKANKEETQKTLKGELWSTGRGHERGNTKIS